MEIFFVIWFVLFFWIIGKGIAQFVENENSPVLRTPGQWCRHSAGHGALIPASWCTRSAEDGALLPFSVVHGGRQLWCAAAMLGLSF